jgi:Na+-transporting methylmalonyl-CoA/oxaloacetate decarboxylase gamma subunit
MDFQQKMQISLIVLFTGLVVVFLMLIALTLIIKGYGSAVHSISKRYSERHTGRPSGDAPSGEAEATEVETRQDTELPAVSMGDIPAETIAAISAAVYCTMPGGRITSLKRAVRKENPSGTAWGMAGRLWNTRPF